MFQSLLRLPIVSPVVLVPVDVVAALLALFVLVGPLSSRGGRAGGFTGRAWARRGIRIGAAVVGGIVGLVLVWWVGDVQNAFGVSLTPITRMWIAFVFAALAVAVVVSIEGPWRRRLVTAVMVVAVAVASILGVNVDFGAYRTIEQAVVTDPYPTGSLGHEHAATADASVVDAATWRAPSSMPKTGKLLSVTIPATVSHFVARKAIVWLPPAAQTADPPTLPVIVSLSGQPGQPSDLFEAGNLGHDLDAYAAAHHGLAPIVVAPDQLGAPDKNPMCVDSKALGDSATYITTDVPHWIRTHLAVASDPAAWSVLGFSEGATCAMQFTTGDPGLFGSALAISSELAPYSTSVAFTLHSAFNGSAAERAAASPLGLMAAHEPYPNHLIVFGYGQDDTEYAANTAKLRAGAVHAAIKTQTYVSPGTAHDWNTVRYVLEHGLPSIIGFTGLPGGSASAQVGPAESHPQITHTGEHRPAVTPSTGATSHPTQRPVGRATTGATAPTGTNATTTGSAR